MIKKWLWRYLIKLEGFDLQSKVESMAIWQEVFNKVPELKDWLKRREITLLKTTTLKDKSNDFILGQIAENRLFQSFDIPMMAEKQIYKEADKAMIDESSFLTRWKEAGEKKHVENKKGGN